MSDEFPLLEGMGLYASDILGDGDCLFRSFSDQLYGHQDKAYEIRRRTTGYMREFPEFFKLFLSVAPPRKGKSSNSTRIPTEDAVDRAFNEHVARMEKSGVYGDNLEIVAFARCYSVNVKIYQRDFAYQISCSDVETEATGKQLLHIAYHSWEHYSSIRNVDGPHSGLPNVAPKPMTAEGKKRQKEIIEQGVVIMPWMEKVVQQSLPGFVSKEKIREMLEKCKGDVNLAVSKLLDEAEDDENVSSMENMDKKEPIQDSISDIENPAEKPASNAGGTSKQASVQTLGKDKPHGKIEKKGNTTQAGGAKPGSGKQQPKLQNRQKKETARERKERQKRENMERKKAKATGSSSELPKTEDSSTKALEAGFRTLHV